MIGFSIPFRFKLALISKGLRPAASFASASAFGFKLALISKGLRLGQQASRAGGKGFKLALISKGLRRQGLAKCFFCYVSSLP